MTVTLRIFASVPLSYVQIPRFLAGNERSREGYNFIFVKKVIWKLRMTMRSFKRLLLRPYPLSCQATRVV